MAKEVNTGTSRKRHSQQYKTEALAVAERIGVSAASVQTLLRFNKPLNKVSAIGG